MKKYQVALLGTIYGASVGCSEESNGLRCDVGTVQSGDRCVVAPHDAAPNGSGGDHAGGRGGSGGGADTGGASGRAGSGAALGSGGKDDAGVGGAGGTPLNSGGSGGTNTGAGGIDASIPGSGGAGGGTGGASSGGTSSGGTSSGGASSGGASSGGVSSTGGAGGPDGGDGGPVATAPFDCGSRDVTNATAMSGTISASATWSGLIHVTGDLSIRNQAVITILAGTKFIIAPGARVEFGALANTPTVIANGRPDSPILFCGEAGTPGYWSSLVLNASVVSSSVFRNVLVADAGTAQTAALVVDAPMLIDGVQVRNSGGIGVQASAFGAGSQKLIVTGSTDAAMALTAGAAAGQVPSGSELTGNGKDQIEVAFSTAQAPVRFGNYGVPYHQKGDVDLVGGATFEAGVEYAIAPNKQLSTQSTTTTEGTAQAPVIFHGENTLQANEGVVAFRDASLHYTRIEGLGRFPFSGPRVPALTVTSNQSVTLDHVTTADCYGIGIELGATLSASSGGISIGRMATVTTANGAPPTVGLRVTTTPALLSLPADTAGNIIAVASYGIDQDGTIRNLGPYLLENGLTISGAISVTVESGTILMFPSYPRTGLVISDPATFKANGSAGAHIRFLGSDQFFVMPWQGIESTSPNVTLSYVEVTRGGFKSSSSTELAGIVAKAPLSLTNSTISNSARYGLLKNSSDTTDYSLTNTFSNNPFGDIANLP